MADSLAPLLLLAALFVAFGLFHRNGESGGCTGCSGCSDPSECSNKRSETDAAAKR